MSYNRKSKQNLCPAWKPGESGNPKGRAWGCFSYKRRFEEGFRDAKIQDMKRQPVEKPAVTVHVLTVEEIDALGPRIQCRVCSHEQLPVINGLLTLGIPLRALARSYGFSKSSVERRKQRHLPVFPYPERAREVVNGVELLRGPIYFLRRVDHVYAGRFQDCTWRVLCDLWKSLASTFGSNPTGRLQLVCLRAILRLAYIAARDWWAEEQNRKDLRIALQALESWGRDDRIAETQDEYGK